MKTAIRAIIRGVQYAGIGLGLMFVSVSGSLAIIFMYSYLTTVLEEMFDTGTILVILLVGTFIVVCFIGGVTESLCIRKKSTEV